MSAHPAKTITAAALAGAAFALAYKATSRYLGGADEEDGNLDDEVKAAIAEAKAGSTIFAHTRSSSPRASS